MTTETNAEFLARVDDLNRLDAKYGLFDRNPVLRDLAEALTRLRAAEAEIARLTAPKPRATIFLTGHLLDCPWHTYGPCDCGGHR